MAYNVYDNPTVTSLGSNTSITGVVSISVNVSYGEIHAAADDETHEGVARYTTGRTSGTIALLDPVVADTLKDSTGTLTFTYNEVKGGTDKTVTIANCTAGGYSSTVARDSASTISVPFIAEALPSIS